MKSLIGISFATFLVVMPQIALTAPNSFGMTKVACLEDVSLEEEKEALKPVQPVDLEKDQTHLVARVVKTFKKSWKQDYSPFGSWEKVKVDSRRKVNQQTASGVIMRSLRQPGDGNKDFARLTHELCHSVGNKGQGYANYGDQLGKSCDIGHYGSMTPSEAHAQWPRSKRTPAAIAHHEHFAEACTLFLLNPERLKKVCAKGYEKMSAVFGGGSQSKCADEGEDRHVVASANVSSGPAMSDSDGFGLLPFGIFAAAIPFLLSGDDGPKPVPAVTTTPPPAPIGKPAETVTPPATPPAVVGQN